MTIERRYSRYRKADVWATLYQQQKRLGVQVVNGSVRGHSVTLLREKKAHRAVVLARSSEWYDYSLNCVERWQHGITCIVCGTHDSCVDVPVLALDSMRWYEPRRTRVSGDDLTPQAIQEGRAIDTFEQHRKSEYGHNVLVGALMCGRADAVKRLHSLPPSTRLRIEAKVKRLRLRRPGRPLTV